MYILKILTLYKFDISNSIYRLISLLNKYIDWFSQQQQKKKVNLLRTF